MPPAETTLAPVDPVLPPGQVLPVREQGHQNVESNRPFTPVERAQAATKVVAIPVRDPVESRMDVASVSPVAVLLPTEEGDFWHATVQQLVAAEAINAMVRELALQSQLVARDTDQWILRLERESLNQTGTRDRLTAALQAAGFPVKLLVEIGRVTAQRCGCCGKAAGGREDYF